MQRSGADVVDAAVGQLIDESDQGLGLSRQSHDRFVAQQGAGLARLHIALADVHAVDLDALAAGLPHHVGAVVDHEGHGVGLLVVLDDLRDVAGHLGQLGGVGVLGSQLNEGGAAMQGLIDHLGQRPVLAVLGADHEVRAQVERIAHGREWVFIAHLLFL